MIDVDECRRTCTATKALYECVQDCMRLRFDTEVGVGDQQQFVANVRRRTRHFAVKLNSNYDDAQLQSIRADSVAPPQAYFAFQEHGKMHLPLIDWSAFRGYSVTLWMYLDSNATATSRSCFRLFRFTTNTRSLGVEAKLEVDPKDPSTCLLSVGSCAVKTYEGSNPSIPKRKGKQDENNPEDEEEAQMRQQDWNYVRYPIALERDKWQFIVLTHSLHYVRKSTVTCFVDTKLQFEDELPYPTALAMATNCTLGGGNGLQAYVSTAAMYQDALTKPVISLLYAQGPSHSSFAGWSTPGPTQAGDHLFNDFNEELVSSTLTMPLDISAIRKLQTVFCFSAAKSAAEDYDNLGVEWVREGTLSRNGRWLTLETTAMTSSEIQQRNARLGPNVRKVRLKDHGAAWISSIGLDGIPTLLDDVLESCNDVQGVDGAALMDIVVHFFYILRGLLRRSVAVQQEVLQQYAFHILYNVLEKHKTTLASLWTSESIAAYVSFVDGLYYLSPVGMREDVDANHPLQESMWTANPLFASGIRALLLDFRLWSVTSYTTQSLYLHELMQLIVARPQVISDLQGVQKLLEILQQFYSSENNKSEDSADRKKCIQTLVEMMEICLRNQSVAVHPFLEEELSMTTFAQATRSPPSGDTASYEQKDASTPAPPTPPTSTSTKNTSTTSAPFILPRRQGGVFILNTENIIWTEETLRGAKTGVNESSGHKETDANATVPRSVSMRFSLLRDLRAVLRFVTASQNAAACASIFTTLYRLAVSFLDIRFALVSSSAIDCLLFSLSSDCSSSMPEKTLHHRLSALPLIIFLLDWLETIEGRTVWCGLEEHLKMLLHGDITFSSGFLELMLELYYDPHWRLSVQHSIIMNDSSKKDSVLFPVTSGVTMDRSGISVHESGIVVAEDGLTAAPSAMSMTGGFKSWMKSISQSTGNHLALPADKRISVVRNIALHELETYIQECLPKDNAVNTRAIELVDENVMALMHLPLRSALPFLPPVLSRCSSYTREQALMELNVILKTNPNLQQRVLDDKLWPGALLQLVLTCIETSVDMEDTSSMENTGKARLSRSHSEGAEHTGEDLVFDTIVLLLCTAMMNPMGWRSFSDVIQGLYKVRQRYQSSACAPSIQSSMVYIDPIGWLSKLVATVLQRLMRSQTILTRVLADNVQKVFFLVQETLLAAPSKSRRLQSLTSKNDMPAWSETQQYLLTAVMDMSSRLVDSTHKLHRTGLAPSVRILQNALSHVADADAMERVVELLVKIFQQEMSMIGEMRVFDAIPTRDVLISALASLRRSLIVQTDEKLVEPLRVLALRISTSGLFDDDLEKAGLPHSVLAALGDHDALLAVLDALALHLNALEMHQKEEESDFVPYFPIAKDLSRLSRTSEGDVAGLNAEVGSTLGGIESGKDVDNTSFMEYEEEQFLGAALEVEKSRMTEILTDVAQHERQRVASELHIWQEHRLKWTLARCKHVQSVFRSQHAHMALAHTAPRALESIGQTYSWRIGQEETPFPARMRHKLDVIVSSDEKLSRSRRLRSKSCEDRPSLGKQASKASSSSLTPLEGEADGDVMERVETPGSPAERANGSLLRRVGRVVAEQSGGEIQDITTDEQDDEDLKESNQNTKEREKKTEQPTDEDQETNAEGNDDTTVTSDVKPSFWKADVDWRKERRLDPGEGVGLTPVDEIADRLVCRRVVPEGMIVGDLYLCNKCVVFDPSADNMEASVSISRKSSFTSNESGQAGWEQPVSDVAPGLHRCWRWKYKNIVAVYLRRYRLRDSGIEIFLANGRNHFLDLPQASKRRRNQFIRVLYSFLPSTIPKQWPGRSVPQLIEMTKAWQAREMSNFEYLMALNTFSGRSFNDLTQYPVFPWVLRDYTSETLDLSDPQSFRDLSKPVGALNADRLSEYWDRYHSFDDPVIPKFLYGSHYSTCAGVVLFFLMRLEPFASLHKNMQKGEFDLPDRLFNSVEEVWQMCNSHMSEVKELTPEFYSDSTFLKNLNSFPFGTRQDQKVVNDVELPPWAHHSPEEFIRRHRDALESEYVSNHLHEWIDLIFGHKQRGKAALKSNNVFYYLTYYGVVDLDKVDDPYLKESMELQIAHFGQCPAQLFNAPHPRRNTNLFHRTSLPSIPTPPSSGNATSNSASSPRKSASMNTSGTSGINRTSVARPLSLAFRDDSMMAQEQRRQWSPLVELKPLVETGIRLLKIYPDHVLTISELGVIEVYHWRLVPKVPSSDASMQKKESGSETPPTISTSHSSPGMVNWEMDTGTSTSTRPSVLDEIGEETSAMESGEEDMSKAFRWDLEIVRDDSPFDFVPRIPVFEDQSNDSKPSQSTSMGKFPVAISVNGRIVVSGGAGNGALHVRFLDSDNGHVVGKASVVGHGDAVTCLSFDRLAYTLPVGQQELEEMLLSGAKDGSLALWRLSHAQQELLGQQPRISSSPIAILRGHQSPVLDCSLSTYLGLAVSCSSDVGMVQYLHDRGRVAFMFEPPDVGTTDKVEFTHVCASIKGFIIAVSSIASPSTTTHSDQNLRDEAQDNCSSVCEVYTLTGTLVRTESFQEEQVTEAQMSSEGDLVIFTFLSGSVRICRLTDFTIVQEYASPPGMNSRISATAVGPDEAVILVATGYHNGTMVLQLLPDADGTVSLLANLRRLLGVNAKLKRMKGTVQQAQTLAKTTIGNARAVSNAARDIAGEAFGEAKARFRGFMTSYLQKPNEG